MPSAGTATFRKLLPEMPLKLVVKGVPSCLKRSTRTTSGTRVVLEITISEDHPPPATNCGRITAFGPPTPAATCGTNAGDERLVTGTLLKCDPRMRKATMATGVSDTAV